MSSRYDIAVGREPKPEPAMPAIVKNKLRKIRGTAACPKCGYSGEIKTREYARGHQLKVTFICNNCKYEG